MQLFLDQMLDERIAERLSDEGHDVISAAHVGLSRADDAEILRAAARDERVLITLDKHFGDWVILPLSQHSGVVRVKVHPPFPENILPVLLPFLARHAGPEFRNQLVIVSRRGERWIKTSGDS